MWPFRRGVITITVIRNMLAVRGRCCSRRSPRLDMTVAGSAGRDASPDT